MPSRREVLESLIALEGPPAEIGRALSPFHWDSEEELMFLKPDDVKSVLQRYVSGRLSSEEVETWANLIEGREDIGLEVAAEPLLDDVIHELANPLLTAALTPDSARRWIERL